MSRIADAYGRADRRLSGDEVQPWQSAQEAAARYLGNSQLPTPNSQKHRTTQAETVHFELASAVRRIFMAPASTTRSLMFCTVPGDPLSDVAWRAAEVLAGQSGQRVAFVEDPANRIAPAGPAHPLIAQVEWWEADETSRDVVGERVTDLLLKCPFVIVNATAASVKELVSLAREVDGVVLVVSQDTTSCDAAKSLVATLERSAKLLGTVLVTP